MGKKVSTVTRHCFDILLFCVLCFTVYSIEKWWTPQKRGFFCNDDSLYYPYRSSTVSANMLVFLVVSVPTIVIFVFEMLHFTDSHNNNQKNVKSSNHNNIKQQQQQQQRGKCNMATPEPVNCLYLTYKRLSRSLAYIAQYFFGLALTLIATELTKFSVGRLRPHFFAICEPILPDGSNCTNIENQSRYIETYTCGKKTPNVTLAQLRDVSMSFPSGHASLFFYAMVYLALYLQIALTIRVSRLLKHIIQFNCILSAVYVGLSRISDFKHHWTDVLAGACLGTFIAVSVACFVARFFQRSSSDHTQFKQPCINAASRALKVSQVNTSPMLTACSFGTLPFITHGPPPTPNHYHNHGYVP